MKVDAAGRRMTLGRRALLRIRDNRLATVPQIARECGTSPSTIKKLIVGIRAEPSIAMAIRMRDRFAIEIEWWVAVVEGSESEPRSGSR